MSTKIEVNNFIFLILCLLITTTGCINAQMSEKITDKSAGLNGGFEVSQNGLPVNWLMYTPNTVSDAEFKIVLDKEVFKEGKQSLRFDVEKTFATGGSYSPGFTNEFFEVGKFEGEATYKLSFWYKNSGTKFRITAVGVKAMGGKDIEPTIIQDNQSTDGWAYRECTVLIPKNRWLKMQLNIIEPGTFWIDDIKIDKIE